MLYANSIAYQLYKINSCFKIFSIGEDTAYLGRLRMISTGIMGIILSFLYNLIQ